ncbi:unnamed protein product [Durusdinium trenchii]|uniref:protein-tyrosine-phosphatase n=1 Tax=Durusdinium trenchii TaxID=1381693 RepID=A0ABP0JUA4_9DINO
MHEFVAPVSHPRPKSGIQCILNAAQEDLYKHAPGPRRGAAANLMVELPQNFDVRIIGAEDSSDCNLSLHFQEIADFIEAGRAKGGVVVHCAAGISRASTSCMAYMMMKEHWSLDAAFRKVHAVRNIVHPNDGFWRQLRDLEASLKASGVELRSLPEDWCPPEQPSRPEDEKGEVRNFSSSRSETMEMLASLEQDITTTRSFITHFLTARIVPKAGVKAQEVQQALLKLESPGVRVEECDVQSPEAVLLRAGLVHSMTHSAFLKLLEGVHGVQGAEVE